MERERRTDAVVELAARLRRELPRLLASSDPGSLRSGLRSLNDEIAALNAAMPEADRLPLLDVDRLTADRR